MPKFYVTYGCGSNLANCYSVIEAPTTGEARALAFEETAGGKFSFLYTESMWIINNCIEDNEEITQAEYYNLKEVPLQPQVIE